MTYLWKMDVCRHKIINIVYRGGRFIRFFFNSAAFFFFFFFTERYLVACSSSLLFLRSVARERANLNKYRTIDCLPYNSSFYLEGCIVESEYPPWDQLRSTI